MARKYNRQENRKIVDWEIKNFYRESILFDDSLSSKFDDVYDPFLPCRERIKIEKFEYDPDFWNAFGPTYWNGGKIK